MAPSSTGTKVNDYHGGGHESCAASPYDSSTYHNPANTKDGVERENSSDVAATSKEHKSDLNVNAASETMKIPSQQLGYIDGNVAEEEVGLKLLFAASLIQSKAAEEATALTGQPLRNSPEMPATVEDKTVGAFTQVSLPPSTGDIAAATSFLADSHNAEYASSVTGQITEESTSDVIEQLTDSEVSDLDVLCGRGGKINKHPGNIAYRRVVEHNKAVYKQVPKRHRILVSQSIVQTIQSHGGRFLQSSTESSQQETIWTTVPFRRAVQKTSQALREPTQAEGDTKAGDK